jgi:hypothetical protein
VRSWSWASSWVTRSDTWKSFAWSEDPWWWPRGVGVVIVGDAGYCLVESDSDE